MITVFQQIPDIFVEAYDYQFQVWAREFRRRGPRQAIVFRTLAGTKTRFDAHGQPVIPGAWLEARQEGPGRMVIRPASEADAELIARHCREMRGMVLQ